MNVKLVSFFVVLGIALAVCTIVPQAKAQTSLGSVTGLSTPQTCPQFRGFITDTDPTVPMVCRWATLSGCSGFGDMGFVYGVAPPAAGKTPLGTIVFFAGDGGVDASDGSDQANLLIRYVNAGYQVVQIAWGSLIPGQDWEDTLVTGLPNILAAACRPATFMNWVRNGNSGVGNGIWGTYHGGMCAQGHSAGSGAIAYALAWYNAGAATASYGQGLPGQSRPDLWASIQ